MILQRQLPRLARDASVIDSAIPASLTAVHLAIAALRHHRARSSFVNPFVLPSFLFAVTPWIWPSPVALAVWRWPRIWRGSSCVKSSLRLRRRPRTAQSAERPRGSAKTASPQRAAGSRWHDRTRGTRWIYPDAGPRRPRGSHRHQDVPSCPPAADSTSRRTVRAGPCVDRRQAARALLFDQLVAGFARLLRDLRAAAGPGLDDAPRDAAHRIAAASIGRAGRAVRLSGRRRSAARRLLAGGIGITPLLSMLRYAVSRRIPPDRSRCSIRARDRQAAAFYCRAAGAGAAPPADPDRCHGERAVGAGAVANRPHRRADGPPVRRAPEPHHLLHLRSAGHDGRHAADAHGRGCAGGSNPEREFRHRDGGQLR